MIPQLTCFVHIFIHFIPGEEVLVIHKHSRKDGKNNMVFGISHLSICNEDLILQQLFIGSMTDFSQVLVSIQLAPGQRNLTEPA